MLDANALGRDHPSAAEDVFLLRAPDEAALLGLARATSGADLFSARTIGEGTKVLALAALDAEGLERGLALVRKAGLERSAVELYAKQGVFVATEPAPAEERIVFAFSGQGSQYGGMMRVLAGEVPAARAVVEAADAWLLGRGQARISEIIFSGAPIPREVFTIQASVLVADLMSFAALRAAGLEHHAVTGHSFGDYAALVAAGVWTLEDALLATEVRAEAINASTVPGGMTSISAPADEVDRLLREVRGAGSIQVANVNAPDQIVVAGTLEALDRVERLASGAKIETVRLEVPRAFHSVLMDGARPRLAQGFRTLTLRTPAVPYLSSVTGRFEDDPEAIRRSLVDQLVLPVDYVGQVERLVRWGATAFVECGPRGVLASLAKRILTRLGETGVAVATSDDAQRPGRFALARVRALFAARAASRPLAASEVIDRVAAAEPIPSAHEGPVITALEGARAAALLGAPGFEEAWREVRPGIAELVRTLFAAERALPSAEARAKRGETSPSSVPRKGPSGEVPAAAPEALEPAAHVEDGAPSTASAEVIAPVEEIMRRHVIRVVDEPAPPPLGARLPRRLLLAGTGARAEALARAFSARGTHVVSAPDAFFALDMLGPDVDAIGLVLPDAGAPAWSLDAAGWLARRRGVIDGPFALLRAFAPARESGLVFAVTMQGGGLGFSNAAQGNGEHGALAGLLKSIRREVPGLDLLLLDTSPSEAPERVAEALVAELDAGAPRLEVGLLRGKRLRLAMDERPLDLSDRSASSLPAAWLVTGGARGVTARIAERIARVVAAAGRRPVLHLLGTHVLPEAGVLAAWRGLDPAGVEALKQSILVELKGSGRPFSALDWKARTDAIDKSLEIARNLDAIARAGAEVVYHAVDLADRAALGDVLARIRRSTKIEGLIHGAGVELAKPFDKKTDSVLSATLGGKLDGLVHLLALTAGDPLSHVVGFSSVSGRFGGHGQTDYGLANEALSHLLAELRAKRPEVRAVALSWPAFGEVGLAVRSSAKTFLERAGQRFMSPAEGANHLVRELLLGLPEPEITISDAPPGLDLDHLLPEDADVRARRLALEAKSRASPLLGHVVLAEPASPRQPMGRLVVERTVHADEPFLAEHRMGRTPILPAVVALEMMAELVALEGGSAVLGDVEIHQPLKVPEGTSRTLEVERRGDHLRLTSAVVRGDGVVLDPARVFVTGRVLPEPSRGELERTIVDLAARATVAATPVSAETLAYPYLERFDDTPGSAVIFHGPPLKVVEWVARGTGGGRARLVVPRLEALVAGSRLDAWVLPSALLDGCLQAAGMLGRLLYGVTALPLGFEWVECSRPAELVPGEGVVLDVVFRPAPGGDVLASDLYARADHGGVLVVRGYRASVLRP